MLYLYFGKTEDDLKNFALRDLGIIRTNKNANLSARFTDEAEARACFHYCTRSSCAAIAAASPIWSGSWRSGAARTTPKS